MNDFNLFTIEQWRDVAGYEGLYEVSNLGRVRSLDMLVRNGNGYRLSKGRILKSALNKGGYQFVNLYKDGKRKPHKVHRLVAQAFIPNPQHFKEVNHINEDKINNTAENLEWCTHEYNCNFGTRNKQIAKANTNGKKSKQVAQINPQTNEIIRIWDSTNECERNGFNHGHISQCCQGKRKSHKGFKWRYID